MSASTCPRGAWSARRHARHEERAFPKGACRGQHEASNARLILDIQPGRSPFSSEVRALERWLREPDVDLALDPEWNVGRYGVPGRTDGSVDARTVNGVSDQLARLVRRYRLPQKLLVIHQFRRESVRYESRIRRRPAVATTLSFDGIGRASAKVAGSRRSARRTCSTASASSTGSNVA